MSLHNLEVWGLRFVHFLLLFLLMKFWQLLVVFLVFFWYLYLTSIFVFTKVPELINISGSYLCIITNELPLSSSIVIKWLWSSFFFMLFIKMLWYFSILLGGWSVWALCLCNFGILLTMNCLVYSCSSYFKRLIAELVPDARIFKCVFSFKCKSNFRLLLKGCSLSAVTCVLVYSLRMYHFYFQTTFMLLLLLLAKGWAVTRLEFTWKPLVFAIWFLYGVVHILLYIWNMVSMKHLEEETIWESWSYMRK